MNTGCFPLVVFMNKYIIKHVFVHESYFIHECSHEVFSRTLVT